MAGDYDDAPGRRMAIDLDGTMLWHRRTNAWDPYDVASGTARDSWADEENAHSLDFNFGDNDDTNYVIAIFPEKRDVDAFLIRTNAGASNGTDPVWTSTDTTTGFDGTWTSRISDHNDWTGGWYPEGYRNDTTALSYTGVRAIRWQYTAPGGGGSDYLKALHIYGQPSTTENPDRLLFVEETTGLEFNRNLDLGDIPRGGAFDRLIVLRNNSSSLTANSVSLTAEALSWGMASWWTFSDGGTYAASLSLASSISNGSDSPDITCRGAVPNTEGVGPLAGRFKVSVGSWT